MEHSVVCFFLLRVDDDVSTVNLLLVVEQRAGVFVGGSAEEVVEDEVGVWDAV